MVIFVCAHQSNPNFDSFLAHLHEMFAKIVFTKLYSSELGSGVLVVVFAHFMMSRYNFPIKVNF